MTPADPLEPEKAERRRYANWQPELVERQAAESQAHSRRAAWCCRNSGDRLMGIEWSASQIGPCFHCNVVHSGDCAQPSERDDLASALNRAALHYHKDIEGEYGCPGMTCPGVKRLQVFAAACAALALQYGLPLAREAGCESADPLHPDGETKK